MFCPSKVCLGWENFQIYTIKNVLTFGIFLLNSYLFYYLEVILFSNRVKVKITFSQCFFKGSVRPKQWTFVYFSEPLLKRYNFYKYFPYYICIKPVNWFAGSTNQSCNKIAIIKKIVIFVDDWANLQTVRWVLFRSKATPYMIKHHSLFVTLSLSLYTWKCISFLQFSSQHFLSSGRIW